MFGFVITFFSYFRISQLTLFKYFISMLIRHFLHSFLHLWQAKNEQKKEIKM